jgi:tetratricopeptide (TPR) repeat protein
MREQDTTKPHGDYRFSLAGFSDGETIEPKYRRVYTDQIKRFRVPISAASNEATVEVLFLGLKRRIRSMLCRVSIVFAALTVAMNGNSSGQQAAEDADKATSKSGPLVEEAVARFRLRDFSGAHEKLREAVQASPELPPAAVFMADMCGSAKLPAAQRRWLQRAVIESPEDPQAYLILGEMAFREGRVIEADLLTNKGEQLVASMSADHARKEGLQQRARYGQLTVAEMKGNWDTAIKYLDLLARDDPDNANLLQRRGVALFHLDKADEALKCFRDAKAADKNRLAPEAVLGQLYEQVGDRDAATDYMTKAMSAAGKDVDTRIAVCRWGLDAGKLDFAKQQAAAALKSAPDSMDVVLINGLVAIYSEDYEAAETHFAKVVAESPNHFSATNGLALALCELTDDVKRARALEYAQANVQKFPRNSQAAATLGWVLYRFDRIDEADKVLGRVVASGNVSPNTAYYVARIAIRRGQAAQARVLLESALGSRHYFPQRPNAEALLEQLQK